MAKPKRLIECPRDPIGLSEEEAAAFISVSATAFRKAWKDDKILPLPRKLAGRNIWDADELAQAFRQLPKYGMAETTDGVDWSNPR